MVQNVHVELNVGLSRREQHSARSKLELHVRKAPLKCYIWSIALCGVETGILWKADMMDLKSFEVWRGRRERSVGPTV
jgi:hypothetical protein